MREVAVYEAKTKLSELLSEVERGEQVTITRRGLPVARLVKASVERHAVSNQRQQVAMTIAALRRQRQGVVLEGDVRDLIGDGRD